MLLHSTARALTLGITACSFAGIAAPCALADVWTVGTDPATSDFVSIQAAIGNAESGDTILIGPGDFTGFQVVSKSLTILGAGSDLTRIGDTFIPPFGPYGTIRISFVDEGPLRVGGFTLTPTEGQSISPQGNRWILAEACNSPIELFDIQIPSPGLAYVNHDTASAGAFWEAGVFAALDCRQLMISDVSVTGYADQLYDDPVGTGAFWNTFEGYAGLSLRNSSAWISNSHFEGCTAPSCGPKSPPTAAVVAGPGARLWNSKVIASNCHFEGARGYAAVDGNCVDIAGGSGIQMKFASQVQLLDGPDAAVLGGDSFCAEPGGSGVDVTGPASVIYGESGTLEGGSDDQGVASAAIAEFSPEFIQVLSLAEKRPSLVPSDNFLQQGDAFQLDLHGNPNGVQVVLWQAALGNQVSSPLVVGDLFLDPANAPMLGVFALDAQGQATTALQVPIGHEFVGISIAMQTTELIHPLFYPAPPIFLATRP